MQYLLLVTVTRRGSITRTDIYIYMDINTYTVHAYIYEYYSACIYIYMIMHTEYDYSTPTWQTRHHENPNNLTYRLHPLHLSSNWLLAVDVSML